MSYPYNAASAGHAQVEQAVIPGAARRIMQSPHAPSDGSSSSGGPLPYRETADIPDDVLADANDPPFVPRFVRLRVWLMDT